MGMVTSTNETTPTTLKYTLSSDAASKFCFESKRLMAEQPGDVDGILSLCGVSELPAPLYTRSKHPSRLDADKYHSQCGESPLVGVVNKPAAVEPLFSPPKGMYVMFHYVKGAPFEMIDQNDRFMTAWEQLDNGEQFTVTRKFLTTVPIVL